MNEGHGFSRAAKSQGTPLQAAEQRYGRRARVQPCRKSRARLCRLRNNVMNEGHGFSRAAKSQARLCRLRNNVIDEGHGFSRAVKSQGTPLQAADQRYEQRARVQPCRKEPGHAFAGCGTTLWTKGTGSAVPQRARARLCRLRNNVMDEGHGFSRAAKSQGTPLQAAEQRYGRRARVQPCRKEPGHAFAGCGTTLWTKGTGSAVPQRARARLCRLRNNVIDEGHGFSRAVKSQGTPLQAADQRYERRARVQPCRKEPGHAFAGCGTTLWTKGTGSAVP